MSKQPFVVYSFVSDDYFNPVGTPQFINSFKRFHPDIPLVIFRQDWVDRVIDGHDVNWLNAKPMFAKVLTNHYDCVINMDVDQIVLGRMDEIFTNGYDVGSVMNFNDYENVSTEGVSEEDYLQAGCVASRIPEFWDIWMARSRKDAWRCKCAENDTLNMVIKEHPEWKLKVFDKKKDYYGCKSLGREKEMSVDNGKIMLRGEEVKCYHYAKGPNNMPKASQEKLVSYGFNKEVRNIINLVGNYGVTISHV